MGKYMCASVSGRDDIFLCKYRDDIHTKYNYLVTGCSVSGHLHYQCQSARKATPVIIEKVLAVYHPEKNIIDYNCKTNIAIEIIAILDNLNMLFEKDSDEMAIEEFSERVMNSTYRVDDENSKASKYRDENISSYVDDVFYRLHEGISLLEITNGSINNYITTCSINCLGEKFTAMSLKDLSYHSLSTNYGKFVLSLVRENTTTFKNFEEKLDIIKNISNKSFDSVFYSIYNVKNVFKGGIPLLDINPFKYDTNKFLKYLKKMPNDEFNNILNDNKKFFRFGVSEDHISRKSIPVELQSTAKVIKVVCNASKAKGGWY